jgi:CO dehydrogenase nickel-insertion accessory protein CooC1
VVKRLAEWCRITAVDSELETARLPPGDEPGLAVIAVESDPDCEPHEVLGVAPGAPKPVVTGALRELVKADHGDQGDNDACDVTALKQVRDVLFDSA